MGEQTMMNAKPVSRGHRTAATRRGSSAAESCTDDGREHISATERWLRISKRVYSTAQKRGFVGGDPFADLAEAVCEVDEQYVTDVSGLLALTDPIEMREQLRSLFAGYGLSRQNLDRLLDLNRESIEKLARLNRSPDRQGAQRAARRKSLLKNTANQAIKSLRSLGDEVEGRTRNIPILGRSTYAANTIITGLTILASSAGEVVGPIGAVGEQGGGRRRERELEVHTMVVKAYEGYTPVELANAPVAALRGISEATGRKLKSAFGMDTIRDLASSEVFEQADGIVTLADAEAERGAATGFSERRASPLEKLASGPLSRIDGVTPHQARVLLHTLKIDTVRDLAGNRFFRLARAIVTLADAKHRDS